MSPFRLRPGRSARPGLARAALRPPVAAPPAGVLTVLGRDTFGSGANGASFNASLVAPAYADGVLVLTMARANGGGNSYSPALTVGGAAASLLGGSHATATSDFYTILCAFYARGAFGGTEAALSLAMGASVRPSGWDVLWLAGTRAQTALGASSFTRGATSASSASGSLTPTSTDSLCFFEWYAVFGSSGVTVDAFTPSAGTRLADRTVGTTGGVGALRYLAPADTSQIDTGVTWSAANTSRGLAALELVR